MNLHHDIELFDELIEICAAKYNIPALAIRKDYYITLILAQMMNTVFYDQLVFKGGTSLSKCYPQTIERFSDDIDLTYVPSINKTNKQINNDLKSIEETLTHLFKIEKIPEERNDRNKACYVWFDDVSKDAEKIKLEIGSNVRPHPFSTKSFQSYIHDFLLSTNEVEVIEKYKLSSVIINVLDIERTFIDKVMAVKRHAICGTLSKKVRHIYDVVKLFEHNEIIIFLNNKQLLKEIVQVTKNTDSFYLLKREIPEKYNPLESYGYHGWKHLFNADIQSRYERLHEDLLYTNIPQDWSRVDFVFSRIDAIFKEAEQ